MATAQRDLEIPVGSTLDFVVDVVGGPDSLTGYAGAMQIRQLRSDAAPLATVPQSGITVNAVTRQVRVRIPSSSTAGYSWKRGVYDLQITGPSGDAWRLVEGRVTTSQPVTRGS